MLKVTKSPALLVVPSIVAATTLVANQPTQQIARAESDPFNEGS